MPNRSCTGSATQAHVCSRFRQCTCCAHRPLTASLPLGRSWLRISNGSCCSSKVTPIDCSGSAHSAAKSVVVVVVVAVAVAVAVAVVVRSRSRSGSSSSRPRRRRRRRRGRRTTIVPSPRAPYCRKKPRLPLQKTPSMRYRRKKPRLPSQETPTNACHLSIPRKKTLAPPSQKTPLRTVLSQKTLSAVTVAKKPSHTSPLQKTPKTVAKNPQPDKCK